MCAMMQKFLMMSMGVLPTAGAAAAGGARRRPAGTACSGTEDTGIPPRSSKGMPVRSSSLPRDSRRSAGHARGCSVHGRTPRELPRPEPSPGRAPRHGRGAAVGCRGRAPRRRQFSLSSAQRWAIADLRFAAWFLWMTPLLAALSRLRQASRMAAVAASVSPASAASRNLRTLLFSDDLTALLRCLAFSFCLLRLIWDLMLATRKPRSGVLICWLAGAFRSLAAAHRNQAARIQPDEAG